MEDVDYQAYITALLEIQVARRKWETILQCNGWDSDHATAANSPDAKAQEVVVMGLIGKYEPILAWCRNNLVRDPSTALDRGFDYIGIYLGRGPEALKLIHQALPECLAIEEYQTEVRESCREPTFAVQLGRWARRLGELAAGGEIVGSSKEVPWRDKAPGYMEGKDAIKLAEAKMSLSTLSKRCTPDGPIRYMRQSKKGKRRMLKVNTDDLLAYLKTLKDKDPDPAEVKRLKSVIRTVR